MKRTIIVGQTDKRQDVEIDVELRQKEGDKGVELSICGAVWLQSRRDIIMGGQCLDSLEGEIKWYADGWNRDRLRRVVAIWKRWHLNGMRAGCEHQRANLPDVSEKRKLYTYVLTSEALAERSKLERTVKEQLHTTGRATLTAEEQRIFSADYTVVTYLDSLPSELYKFKSSEEKALGWLKQSEHPDGLLSKPCEVCGYKYGNAWLFEQLPADVLAEIEQLTGVVPEQPRTLASDVAEDR